MTVRPSVRPASVRPSKKVSSTLIKFGVSSLIYNGVGK